MEIQTFLENHEKHIWKTAKPIWKSTPKTYLEKTPNKLKMLYNTTRGQRAKYPNKRNTENTRWGLRAGSAGAHSFARDAHHTLAFNVGAVVVRRRRLHQSHVSLLCGAFHILSVVIELWGRFVFGALLCAAKTNHNVCVARVRHDKRDISLEIVKRRV